MIAAGSYILEFLYYSMISNDGLQFLLYLNNTDEKAQMHNTDGGKMLTIGNQVLRR